MISDYKINIIKNFKRRYLFALAFLSFFTLLTYFYFVFSKRTLEKDGYMINISGRQRYLSQQIPLFVMQFITNNNPEEKNSLHEKLIQSIDELKLSHSLLAHDSVSISSYYHSAAVDSIYFKAPENLNKKMDAFLYHAILLGKFEKDSILLDNVHLKYILAASPGLLSGLNDVVDQYQYEYEQEVKTTTYKITFLTIGAFIAYLLIGVLIFRPMTNKINNTLTDLENKEEEVEQINETHVASIIDAQEKERQRIASDLHDGLIQTLTSMAYKFDIANKNSNSEQGSPYDEAKVLINNAINETRNVAYRILPPLLKEFGLVPALNSLSEQVKVQGKINIDFQTFNFSERLEDGLELTLYRIAQEAFTNIIKYAEAKNVRFQLIRHPNSLVMIIEDDGKGFDTSKNLNKKGIGLKTMRDRIKIVHGNFVINSSSKMGTEIMAEIPIENNEQI